MATENSRPKRQDKGPCKGGEIAIIADDLTGAMDTGAQFCKEGIDTTVYLDVRDISGIVSMTPRPEVIVIDTDTRWVDPATAYRVVKAACEALRNTGVKRVYKKVDSTLRGNIGAELDAAMDVWGARLACVAPAFPATRRITVDGYQLLGDQPVEKTEVASDLLSPVQKSHIPTLLRAQTRRKVGHIPLEVVKGGSEMLLGRIRAAASVGEEILVIDATTQEHLNTVARAIAEGEFQGVVCGSAGLASELPQAFGLARRCPERPGATRHPLAVISGSRSQVTRRQVRYLSANLPIRRFSLGLGAGPDPSSRELERLGDDLLDRIIEAVRGGNDVVISASDGVASASNAPAGRDIRPADASPAELSLAIVSLLGRMARRILDSASLSGIVLTGGDTAAGVCRAIEASGIALKDEILPGIPVGVVIGGPFDGLTVVTKAGAFGDEDALVKVIEYLERPDRGRNKPGQPGQQPLCDAL